MERQKSLFRNERNRLLFCKGMKPARATIGKKTFKYIGLVLLSYFLFCFITPFQSSLRNRSIQLKLEKWFLPLKRKNMILRKQFTIRKIFSFIFFIETLLNAFTSIPHIASTEFEYHYPTRRTTLPWKFGGCGIRLSRSARVYPTASRLINECLQFSGRGS